MDSAPADIIISGVGMQFSGSAPMDTKVCEAAARTMVSAVEDVKYPDDKKPLVVVISSTGISSGPRDVPIAYIPLYKVLLKTPHEDKRLMENAVVQAAAQGTIGSYVVVRPTLFKFWGAETTKEGERRKAVRVGREANPAVGYLIERGDVGRWVFEECVVKGGEGWKGERVSLTW